MDVASFRFEKCACILIFLLQVIFLLLLLLLLTPQTFVGSADGVSAFCALTAAALPRVADLKEGRVTASDTATDIVGTRLLAVLR